MIESLIISALYLLGMKTFYEYDKEVMPQPPAPLSVGDRIREALWYASWPLMILVATALAAMDKGTDE